MGELVILEAGEAAYQDITDRLAKTRNAWVFHDGRLDRHLLQVPRGAVARTGATQPQRLLHELVRLGGGLRPVRERFGTLEVPFPDPGLVVVAPGDALGCAVGRDRGPSQIGDVLSYLARDRTVVLVLDD